MFNESLANGHQTTRKGETKSEGELAESTRERRGERASTPGKCPVHWTGEMAGRGGCTPDQ
jgi:hypothetical protein